jgi:hypothetical protein
VAPGGARREELRVGATEFARGVVEGAAVAGERPEHVVRDAAIEPARQGLGRLADLRLVAVRQPGAERAPEAAPGPHAVRERRLAEAEPRGREVVQQPLPPRVAPALAERAGDGQQRRGVVAHEGVGHRPGDDARPEREIDAPPRLRPL